MSHSTDGGASRITLEVLSRELGDQIEAEKLPPAYLAHDDKDDTFVVAVGGRDTKDPVVRHLIEHQRPIDAEALTDDGHVRGPRRHLRRCRRGRYRTLNLAAASLEVVLVVAVLATATTNSRRPRPAAAPSFG